MGSGSIARWKASLADLVRHIEEMQAVIGSRRFEYSQPKRRFPSVCQALYDEVEQCPHAR